MGSCAIPTAAAGAAAGGKGACNAALSPSPLHRSNSWVSISLACTPLTPPLPALPLTTTCARPGSNFCGRQRGGQAGSRCGPGAWHCNPTQVLMRMPPPPCAPHLAGLVCPGEGGGLVLGAVAGRQGVLAALALHAQHRLLGLRQGQAGGEGSGGRGGGRGSTTTAID